MSYNRLVPRSERQVIFDDIATTLKLEKGRRQRITRVDYNVMGSLGIHIGDIISIGKEKATTAMFMPLEGIDRLTRYDARVTIGEFVTISKTNGIAADKITMKPLTAMTFGKSLAIDERYLRDALTNVSIRPIDLVVIPYFKIGLTFTVIDIISFNGNHMYVGSGSFTVSTNSKFEIMY